MSDGTIMCSLLKPENNFKFAIDVIIHFIIIKILGHYIPNINILRIFRKNKS